MGAARIHDGAAGLSQVQKPLLERAAADAEGEGTITPRSTSPSDRRPG
jgi:hypothetical protein